MRKKKNAKKDGFFCVTLLIGLDCLRNVNYLLLGCYQNFKLARVAELVDALVLGTSAFGMGVRVPPLAPLNNLKSCSGRLFLYPGQNKKQNR